MTVPRRELNSSPSLLATRQLEGDVNLELAAQGTVFDPRSTVHVTKGFASSVVRTVAPLDASLVGRYRDGARGAPKSRWGTEAQKPSKQTSRSTAAWPSRSSQTAKETGTPPFARRSASSPWRACRSSLTRNDRSSVGPLSIEDFTRTPAPMPNRAAKFQVGPGALPDRQAHFGFDGRRAEGGLRLEQSDGLLDAQGKVALDWAMPWFPRRATPNPLRSDIKAD